MVDFRLEAELGEHGAHGRADVVERIHRLNKESRDLTQRLQVVRKLDGRRAFHVAMMPSTSLGKTSRMNSSRSVMRIHINSVTQKIATTTFPPVSKKAMSASHVSTRNVILPTRLGAR
jgi:hypothetical protein